MKARAIALVAALGACGGYRSNYVRSNADARELIWAYDNRFQVTRDRRVVAEEGDWAPLSAEVACVPQAREWAETASSRDGTGKVLLWTGVAAMLVGAAVGTGIVVNDTDDALTGLGVIGGGLVIGLFTAPTGAVMRARAETRAIDAVNLYNDERAACGQRRP